MSLERAGNVQKKYSLTFSSLDHNLIFALSIRSTTCVVVYLMLKYDWNALQALRHIRSYRPVEVIDYTNDKIDMNIDLKSHFGCKKLIVFM